jgi:hypothetical protein
MRRLVLLALVGLLAQLVEWSLGMGYGVTSATLLVVAGIGPAAASAALTSRRPVPSGCPGCGTTRRATRTGAP